MLRPPPPSRPYSIRHPLAPLQQVAALGDIITDIKVKGTERLEPETVVSYLTMAKGDQATSEKIDASLKALYATGLFKDINIEMDGSTLVVKVTENPIINRITFEGEDAISKDDHEKEIQLKPRLVYTLPRVQRDVQRILELYRRSGRFAATVDPKIVKLPQNRVDLVFEIVEGTRTGVRSIKFVGNEHYEADDLQEAISTRESAWWRFLSNTDYYDPDRLNDDRELLRRFYLNEGYVDFRVLSAVAELTPDREDFFITFTVEEGARYKFGKISINSEIKGLDGEKLRQYLTTKEGEWYSADQIDKSVTSLTTVLGDKQYAFANIIPMPDRHKDTHIVDLVYDIKQGERVYIGRINITGNTRTIDKVIRREMQLAEGDPFSATKVHLSEQKLKDLNFFEVGRRSSRSMAASRTAPTLMLRSRKNRPAKSRSVPASPQQTVHWATSTSMKATLWAAGRMPASAPPFPAVPGRSIPASPSLIFSIAISRLASTSFIPRPTTKT